MANSNRLIDKNDGRKLLTSMDVYIIPVANPDGYQYTWTYEQKPGCEECFQSYVDYKRCESIQWKKCADEFFIRLWRKNRQPFLRSLESRTKDSLDTLSD